MKTPLFSFLITLVLIPALMLSGCATPLGKQLTAVQNSPTTQNIETAAATVGLSLAGEGALTWLAPVAVNGLTLLADGGATTNSVTGSDITADTSKITSTIAATIPTTAGKAAATAIAAIYQAAAPTPATANSVLGSIATGIANGITQAATQAGATGLTYNVHQHHFYMALPDIYFYFDLEQQSRVRFRSTREMELRDDEEPSRRPMLV